MFKAFGIYAKSLKSAYILEKKSVIAIKFMLISAYSFLKTSFLVCTCLKFKLNKRDAINGLCEMKNNSH